jgi:hypothetical protein
MRLLTILLLINGLVFAGGVTPSRGATKKELSAEEVKKRVESFGVGATARVKVKLRDGGTMEGFIDSAGDDYFYLVRTDSGTGVAAVIAYADVAQISGQKSTLDWRGIGYKAGMGARVLFNVLRSMRLYGPRVAPSFPDR